MAKKIGFLRSMVFAGAVVAALAVSFVQPVKVAAQSAGQFVTSLLANDAIQIYRQGTAANVFVTAENLAAYTRGQSLLYTTIATAATTVSTGELTLASYTLPANTCDSGTKFLIRSSFSAAATANNKTMRLYFGSAAISSGTVPLNGQNNVLQLMVTCQGGNSQIVWGTGFQPTTAIVPYVNYAASVVTGTILIKATGQNASAATADIILNDFSVERLGG